MRKVLLTSAAIAMLAAGAAQAQTQEQQAEEALGATAGGATGAAVGAVVGGPVGAIIGGFAGAVIGSAAAVPEPVQQYVVANPVAPVAVEQVEVGRVVPETVAVQPIPDYPDYGYIYVDNRPVVVEMASREIVYSPGYVVPQQTITYVEQNPVEPIVIEGGIEVGATVPAEVQLAPIPENPGYSYIYVDGRPALVDMGTRTVVWVK